MSALLDSLEARHPELRERQVFAALPAQIANAKAKAPGFAQILAGVDPDDITSRDALARLPVTRKSDLAERQKSMRPFGGLAAAEWGELSRAYASPGPIYEPEGRSADWWRFGRAMYAAGFRKGDLVHNCFAYHFTPAGFMVEGGAQALGCTVFPGGTGQTEMQVQAMADLKPAAYVGTPSFLRIILEKADELHVRIDSLRKALVGGEAFLAPHREALKSRNIDGYQVYATADLGCIAYESSAREGLIVDEGVLVEIVRPGTGDPVPEGEVGEVVVTALANSDYPLIRFGTGDLSAVLPGVSPCGRTNVRIKGWMGRADQTTKVKGMFVHPGQVAQVVARHPEIAKARLVVENPDGNDRMTLHVEPRAGATIAAEPVIASIRDVTKLRGECVVVPPATLANDGKVIDDRRKFD
ncbi:MAG TPA: AMP-binding protein [Casimicrobiaceae bacterium]|nr:AMP-binding protein [Casimicrobiaceae bacterium]